MSWFKQFIPKEPAGLEGRVIDIGNLKVHIRNAIAEGGFSCVYLARDAGQPSKQYALKHMICNDDESLDLVKKEISVLRMLKGHPNVVMLHASAIFDMGRTKEAFLVMEFCEKSLVTVLENRGAGYFEEKQVLLIFRDVCNAVFAMHCQSPAIAHRDLKAENVLLGANGSWKLCDFGSTSTNHKCFDRPEEMGIEEDNIRKHTTPAYRAPEMWDLFRKEVISEKVDIWALGCLLYRICYFKSAFDGESKLQILNGNYRIPELPKYSSSMTNLIKDMLQASPEDRPDITQVWFRVNLQLPEELQRQTPDGPITVTTDGMHNEGSLKKSHLMPRRSPPPPPSSREHVRTASSHTEMDPQHSRNSPGASSAGGGGSPLGAFWSTQHAQNSQTLELMGALYDKELISSKHNQQNLEKRTSPTREQHVRSEHLPKRSDFGNSLKKADDSPTEDFEIRFDTDKSFEKTKGSLSEKKATFENDAFNNFVAEFDTSKLNSESTRNSNSNSRSLEKDLEAEVERLKEQLDEANMEKAEMTSKYEKLSAICRSQRQEIQELKNALAAATPSPPNKDPSRNQSSPGNRQTTLQREKIEGSVWELQQGILTNPSASPNPQSKPWQPFAETNTQTASKSNRPRSVRTTNGHQNTKQGTSIPANDSWGFGHDSFTAAPLGGQISRTTALGSTSQRITSNEVKKVEAQQPAGWAGF